MVVNKENFAEKRPVDVGDEQPGSMQEVIPQMVVLDKGEYRPPNAGEKGVPSLTTEDQIIVGGLVRVRPGSTRRSK